MSEAIVMANDVVNHLLLDATGDIDIGHDHVFALFNGIAKQSAVWPDDDQLSTASRLVSSDFPPEQNAANIRNYSFGGALLRSSPAYQVFGNHSE